MGVSLVNQWGRDGNSGGQGGGVAAIIITGVLALAVGLGGGYAGARLLVSAPGVTPKPVTPAVSADGSLYKLYQDALKQREDATRDAAALRMELVQQKSRAASIEAELKALRTQVTGAEADASAEGELHRQIEAAASELAKVKDDLDSQRNANTRLSRQREQALREAGDLKLKLTDLTGQVNELAAAKENLELHARQTSGELDDAKKSVLALSAERDQLNGELEKARKQIDALTAAATDRQATATEDPEPEQQPADTPDEGARTSGPRAPDAVTDALARAPGLKSLSFGERRQLAEKLEKGACVTDALEDIFVRVPVLTLRSLIRDLDSPC